MKFFLLFFLSFIFEFADSSIGMGYGTSLTPILILIGFSPSQIVPCILLSEFITGILSGFFHHKFGNVNFDFRRDEKIVLRRLSGLGYVPRSEDAKVSFLLIIFGVIGAIFSVILALNIPKKFVNLYISIMVTGIGIYILINLKKKIAFKKNIFLFVAFLSGFNKGISAGGYGPLVTGGQIISGRSAKSSIGSTSLAEGIICFVSFLIYIFLEKKIDFKLALPLLLGASLSTPFSALVVKKIEEKKMKIFIGILIIILGVLNIFKLLNI
ncbi:MAG: sulfite exporter TauE/SafE family protein [candidate division WOR-3 bacterium]